jgi:hypothetical protein
LFTKSFTIGNGSLVQAISLINSCTYRCAHNGIGFDDVVLQKLLQTQLTSIPLDTLIITKLMYTEDELLASDVKSGIDKNLWGKFSLKAFGQRLGNFKIDFEDFTSGYTDEMGIYCKQDTDLTADLLLHLLHDPTFPKWNVLTLETEAAKIIAEQTEYGFYFDIESAKKLNAELLGIINSLAIQLTSVFKPKFLKDGKVKTYSKPSKLRKYLPNDDYKPLLGTHLKQ